MRIAEAAEDGQLMKRALGGMRNGKLKAGFNTWCTFTAERREATALMKRAIAKATPLGRALAGWIARCARRHDDPRARAVAFMRNRKLPPALHRWCEEVEVRRQLRRAVSGIGNAPLRMAYNTWFATVSTAAEARAAVEKALMSIVSPEVRAVRKGFNSWLEVYAQVCLMRKAGLSLRQRGLRAALNAWISFADEKRVRDARQRAALRKMSPEGRAMSKALNTLMAALEMHRLLLRAGAALFYRAARKAFSNWRFVVEQSAYIEATLRRVSSGQLVKALNQWKSINHLLAQKTPYLKKAASRIVNQPLSQAWNCWAGQIAEAQAKRRALGHFRNRGLALGWRSWLAYFELMETMAMAAAAFRNMGLRKSFNAFYAYLVAQEEMCAHGVIELRLIVLWDGSSRLLDSPPLFPFPCRYALLQRGASGMTAGPLRKAWNAWVERAGRGDPRERALAHFRNREASRALLKWVEEGARYLIMLNALSALANRELRRGMNAWRQWIAERNARNAQLATTLARMSPEGRAKVKALNKLKHLLALLAPLRAALARLVHRNLFKAVGSLKENSENARLRRQMVAAFDPQRRSQARILRTWRAGGAAAAARLSKLEAKARAMMSGPLLKALNKWKGLGLQWGRMRRAALAVMNAKLKRGMNDWRASEYELEGLSIHLAPFAPQSSPLLAFPRTSCRIDFVNLEKAAKEKMAAQLRKFSPEGRALLRALNQWKEAGRLQRKMKQAAAAIKYRHARAGLNSWAAAAAEMAERRERMSAALYKMSPEGRAKAKAFNKMTAGMEVWRLMRKGLAALVQRQTRAALNGWFVN